MKLSAPSSSFLQNLTDSELLAHTREVAKQEQSYSLKLIEHLIEVDARKLYATLNYDSLFKYVAKELGYGESTAYERIRAMRLVRHIPEAREKLKSGALTLSSAAQVESFRCQERLPEAETVKLVEEASHKSLREVEILLLSKSDNPIPKEKIRQITPELQEAKLILTPELQALIQRFEELNGKKPLSQILEQLLGAHLKKHDPLQKAEAVKEKANAAPARDPKAITVSAKLCVMPAQKAGSRYIAVETRKALWMRSEGRCEGTDPRSHARCTSRFRLTFDHHPKPFAQGGLSTFENLRHVCKAHNARFAVETYGVSAKRPAIGKS